MLDQDQGVHPNLLYQTGSCLLPASLSWATELVPLVALNLQLIHWSQYNANFALVVENKVSTVILPTIGAS